MEAIKMVISAMPAWMAVVCLFGGVFIGALALVRLGYSVVVAKGCLQMDLLGRRERDRIEDGRREKEAGYQSPARSDP